jgi:hypothetical protein
MQLPNPRRVRNESFMVQWAGLTLVTAGLFVATHVLRWR